MTDDPLLIVGAGPAGLALAAHHPGETLIVERGDVVGGLSRSIEIDGAMFDIGGHSFHTPHDEVRAWVGELMRGNWSAQMRDARIFFDNQLIAYPFQTHYAQLRDAAVVRECAVPPLAGAAAETFEDWIVARFGAGIARHFMLPYNRKLWARDLGRISCEWVGERVHSAARADRPGAPPARQPLQHDAQVGYPADGGFGAIFEAMAGAAGEIAFGADITRIDPQARRIHAADGRSWRWGTLASTMPLPLLLDTLPDVPETLTAAAARLERVALRVLLIVVGDPLRQAPQRVYAGDPAIPPHKVAFNHTSSERLRARPVHAVMCEISHSPEKPLLPDAELERRTVEWLRGAGLVPPHAPIRRIVHLDIPYGYPVYTHERPAIMREIAAWLRARGIWTLGRFGAWDYANSDECIRQGMALARLLAAGREDAA